MQLTTDGFLAYLEAVVENFGSQIDFAPLVKMYGGSSDGATGTAERKYRPAVCTGAKKTVVSGNPDPMHISTSYVGRQNLTMHMRSFTMLTNCFSKKIENNYHAISLHIVYYNFCKIHTTLRVTPAMEAKLTKRVMSIEDIVRLVEK